MNERVASPEWVVNDRADRKVAGVSGGWGVRPAPLMRGASFTDFSTHEMAVPVGESEQAQAVRFHELIHARISPAAVPSELMTQIGVSPMSVRVAEEWRVNFVASHLAKYGEDALSVVRHLSDGTESASADFAVSKNDWKSAVYLLASTANTDAYKVVKRRLRRNPEWKDAVAMVDKYLTDNGLIVGRKTRLWHGELAHDTRPVRYEWVRSVPSGEREQTYLPDGFVSATLTFAVKLDEWVNDPPSGVSTRFVMGQPEHRNLKDSWEELRFGLTNLTETTSSFVSRRRRPSISGKVPRRPDRLLTDPERRIFTDSVRGIGGVVVFDCSGSMGVEHSDIREAVRQFAGATVVAYTSNRHARANAWVLARNGRMISEADFEDIDLNNGNGVDLPILEWAVRQRKSPKDFVMWVSDGHVTGRGDWCSESLLDATAKFCQKHNIIGAEHADEAVALLADMKRRGSFPRGKHCAKIREHLDHIKLSPTIETA